MASVVPLYIPPPPGLNYLDYIGACYTFVLISLPLSSMLVPILFLILFFSTTSSRKTLLFALNIIIVLLGIVEGVLSTVVQSIIILHPQHPVSDRLFLAYIGIALYTPIIVDCILILRLSAVYPASLTPRANRLAILAVPLLCTVARIVCVTLSVHRWAVLGGQSSALMASEVIWPRNPVIIADWSIQLFESFYCSALFLFRLRGHKAFSSRMYRQQSIAARLRAVFYIALSNFVFPSILSVFQLTYVIHDHSVVHGATVLMVNNYISIIGVVFCTIWCASDVWKDSLHSRTAYGPYPNFTFRQSVITLSGIAPNLNTSPTQGSLGFPRTTNTPVSHRHGAPPFSGFRPYESYGKDMDIESGTNLTRTLNGDASDAYLQTLTLHRIPVDTDADPSADSHSPITPHDVRVILDSKEKGGPRWGAVRAPPSERRSLGGGSHLEPDAASSFTDSDAGIELSFVTPTPPSSHRRYGRHSRSLSLSDSSDYRGREQPRHRDIGEIRGPPARAEDERRHSHVVYDGRRLHPFLENGRHTSLFMSDDDRPSLPCANRPSPLDWSDAELGGGTPSWDGRSLEEP